MIRKFVVRVGIVATAVLLLACGGSQTTDTSTSAVSSQSAEAASRPGPEDAPATESEESETPVAAGLPMWLSGCWSRSESHHFIGTRAEYMECWERDGDTLAAEITVIHVDLGGIRKERLGTARIEGRNGSWVFAVQSTTSESYVEGLLVYERVAQGANSFSVRSEDHPSKTVMYERDGNDLIVTVSHSGDAKPTVQEWKRVQNMQSNVARKVVADAARTPVEECAETDGRVTVYSKPAATIITNGVARNAKTPGTVCLPAGQNEIAVRFLDGRESDIKIVGVQEGTRVKVFYRQQDAVDE